MFDVVSASSSSQSLSQHLVDMTSATDVSITGLQLLGHAVNGRIFFVSPHGSIIYRVAWVSMFQTKFLYYTSSDTLRCHKYR